MSAAFCTKSVLLSTLVVLAVSVMIVRAQETLPQAPAEAPPVAAEVGAEEYSYAIGLQIGTGFQSDGVELNVESLMAGVRDGLAQAEPKLDEATLLAALQHLGKVRMESLVGQNEKFLEKNKEAEGVKVMPSGLQVKVLKSGDGPSPSADDTVRTHYRGTLIDGTEFDSSYARNEPAEFPVSGVIAGWTEALQKMKVGDKWQLVIPSHLAYGEGGAGDVIPPHATLIFEIELLDIVE